MAFQVLCLLFFVHQALAASTAGRKWCSGDVLKGFLENGEEGCCIPEGLCHNPSQAKVLVEQLEHIGKPTTRRKRSLDMPGYQLREHLMSKQSSKEEDKVGDMLLGPAIFQEKARKEQETCPAGCSQTKMDICAVETKLSFPVFGMSVTTKKKVHLIQAKPMFDQPVVRRLCKQKTTSLLQGKCNQIYQPQLMFVDPGTIGVTRMDLDYIYVESGCEASIEMLPSADNSDSSMDTSDLSDSLELVDVAGRGLEEETEPEVKAASEDEAEPEVKAAGEDESPVKTSAPEEEIVALTAPAQVHAVPAEIHGFHAETEHTETDHIEPDVHAEPESHAETDEVHSDMGSDQPEHEVVVMGETSTAPPNADSFDPIADTVDHAANREDPVDHVVDWVESSADSADHEVDWVDHAEDTMEAANLEGSEEMDSATTTIHP